MARISVVLLTSAAVVIAFQLTASAQPTPQPPIRPTAETCAMYRSALAAQIQSIYKRTAECMRKGPSWSTWAGSESDRRPWCVPGPPVRLRAEITAYPDCAGEQEALCDAYEAEKTSVPACFGEVRTSQSEQERRFALANDMMDLHRRYKRAENIIQNPEVFLREVVLPRLPAHVKAKLDMYEGMVGTETIKIDGLKPLPIVVDATTFGVPRQLSKNGTGIMQDLYNYLFDRTAGNSTFRSDNPVIAVIQGNAASQIKSVHSSMLGEMERVANLMDSFVSPATPITRPPQGHAPIRQTTSPPSPEISPSALDCSILDGPGRTDLAVRKPDLFELLVERCLGK